MPLPNILRKASSYILGVQTGTPSPPSFTDGETIFCESIFTRIISYTLILGLLKSVIKNVWCNLGGVSNRS
jgi:hypothetical protein